MTSLSLSTYEELHLNLLFWRLTRKFRKSRTRKEKKDARKLKTKVILIQSKIDYQTSDALILRNTEVQ